MNETIELDQDSLDSLEQNDAAWILANTFRIFTMQTGFGMLEAGSVSRKNIANIMVKNIVDVCFGGLVYWTLGYGLSFGESSNGFSGYSNFAVTAWNSSSSGALYTHYIFHFSFATAATTIVSGAVAERMKLICYMIFSSLNVIIYCFPASWVWNKTGFLKQMHYFDFAGASVVHLGGGASALVATLMLGPRRGRFHGGKNQRIPMSSPVTALTGTFMLWWAWLSYNCGSSYGVSQKRWAIAAKAAVVTMNGSVGGAITGLLLGALLTFRKGVFFFDISYLIVSILGGLVSVTASCPVISPAEGLMIGAIGASVSVLGWDALGRCRIDDPVGSIAVHLGAAMWSIVSVGLFGRREHDLLPDRRGFFYSWDLSLLGIQSLGMIIVLAWSLFTTFIILFVMDMTIGLRMTQDKEVLGADWVEHGIFAENAAVSIEDAFEEMSEKHEEIEVILTKVLTQISHAKRRSIDDSVLTLAGDVNGGVSTPKLNLNNGSVYVSVPSIPNRLRFNSRGQQEFRSAFSSRRPSLVAEDGKIDLV